MAGIQKLSGTTVKHLTPGGLLVASHGKLNDCAVCLVQYSLYIFNSTLIGKHVKYTIPFCILNIFSLHLAILGLHNVDACTAAVLFRRIAFS